MTLVQFHLILVSAWLGLIIGESVLELCSRNAAARRFAARIHGWIDIVGEGPLIVLIVVTGGLLLARNWPPSPLLLVKVGCALVAVAANVYCIWLVQVRMRADDDRRIARLTRGVKLTGYAIPFAIAALVIGLSGAAK